MNIAVVKIWSLICEGYFMKLILYAEHIAKNDTKNKCRYYMYKRYQFKNIEYAT